MTLVPDFFFWKIVSFTDWARIRMLQESGWVSLSPGGLSLTLVFKSVPLAKAVSTLSYCIGLTLCILFFQTMSASGPVSHVHILARSSRMFPLNSERASDASENEVRPEICASLDPQIISDLITCRMLCPVPSSFYINLNP